MPESVLSSLPEVLATACGTYLTVSTRTRSHLLAHPDACDYLKEAVAAVRLPSGADHAELSVDLGRSLGLQKCIETAPIGMDDETWFVQRKGRLGATRTTLSGVREETSLVTIIADRDWNMAGTWRLTTAWVGGLAKPEPWDPRLVEYLMRSDATAFWLSHALIVDPREADGDPYKSTMRHEVNRANLRLQEQRRLKLRDNQQKTTRKR